jgi:hypothetical protein
MFETHRAELHHPIHKFPELEFVAGTSTRRVVGLSNFSENLTRRAKSREMSDYLDAESD